MQTPRPPTAQNCQMIKAHSSSATGKAITKPRAKPRSLGDRADPLAEVIGWCFSVIVKPSISNSAPNTFDHSYHTFVNVS